LHLFFGKKEIST